MWRIDSLAIKILHRVRKFWELFILTVLIGGTFVTVWAVARPGNVFDPRRYAADNMCNVDGRTCSKPEEWERGWIEARQAEYINKAPVQNEYTSANPANDSSQGVTQEAQIIRQAGESNEVNRSSIAAEEAAKKNDPVNKLTVTDPTLPPLLPTVAGPTIASAPTVQPTINITPAASASPSVQPTIPAATPVPERYGITDNICHLPGANCTGEDWQRGNAAARGDTKALEKLKETNNEVFSTVTVDGGVVKQNSPTIAPVVPTTTPTATATTDAQARRAEFTKQCAKDLHLCPMIDPATFQVVGWVPADEASFGTYEDAKLARQKLSIGDLRKYNIPELLSEDKLRSATADEMQKELTKAFSGEEGAKLISQLKNTPSGSLVKLDAQGAAVKTKDGDIVLNSGETLNKKTQIELEKRYFAERVADAKTQDDTANALLASLANKLEDCLKEGKAPDGICGISKLTPAEKQKYDDLTEDRKKEISSGQTFQKLRKGVSDSYNQKKLAIETLARSGTAAITAQCVAKRGEQLCNTTTQIDLYIAGLAKGFDAATEGKIKATYDSKKKEEEEKFIAKLHNDDKVKVQQDVEKNVEQAASILISITVKQEDRNLAIRQLIYGNIDFSKYPSLTESEKQEFQKDYFNRRYFTIQTYLTSDEIKNYQAEINVLKQELPQPGGGGLKSIAKTQIPSVDSEEPQTAPQLTAIQQAQLTAAQTGLGIVNWWNNTGLAQGINKRATDLGVINAQSPEESVGRFLNTTTAGAFGQYVSTYADINAQNPDASYLDKAFNPQGLDASQALLAQAVTATLPDNGQYSGQIVNGVFNAPLIGARRYIDAGVVGSTALSNNNTGQLLQANAYGAYHIFGIDDTVNASNRLFYQTGMSSAEAEAYVNNPWLRAGDAVTVGMSAVSVGDVTASIKVSGLEKTLIQGPLSQRGIEQGSSLFAKGFVEAEGNLGQKILGGTKNIYQEGMPRTQKAVEGFLSIIGRTEGSGGAFPQIILQTKKIGVMPDSHSMQLDNYKQELFNRGIIDANGNPLEGIILGDHFGKTTSDLLLASPTQTPGNDLLIYTADLAKRSNGKIQILTGNWEPRATVAVAAALRGDAGQLEAILLKTLPESEVMHIISSPENIRTYIDSIGQLKTVVKIGDTVFSHTDTAQELLYSLDSNDLKKLSQTNPQLAENIRYLIYQQKYSGVESYNLTAGIEILRNKNQVLAQQVEQALIKYQGLPKDTLIDPIDAKLFSQAYEKILKEINSDRLLTADEIAMFGQAYKELYLSPSQITDKINTNVSTVLTGGIEAQINPETGIVKSGNLSNKPGGEFLQNAFDIEANKAYKELQIFHNNISEGEAYWKGGGSVAQAYANALETKQLAFGHTPLSQNIFSQPMVGVQRISPGVYQTGEITLYNFDTNLSEGMQSMLLPTKENPKGFLPIIKGTIQLPENRDLLKPYQKFEGPTSINVTFPARPRLDITNKSRVPSLSEIYAKVSPYIEVSSLLVSPESFSSVPAQFPGSGIPR